MGKRTIGELQPFEFVITLAVADLACTPMQDISVPILYGVVPLCVLIVSHYAITLIAAKLIKFRKVLNGKPQIIIDENGINSECLTKLNLNVNDVMQLIRQQGYFSIPEVKFGIIETNGKLSILPNDTASAPNSIPMTLILESSVFKENLNSLNLTEEQIDAVLDGQQLKRKDIILMTADSGSFFIQPKNKKYITVEAGL